MSMFRKPKKIQVRRIFADDAAVDMDVDEERAKTPPPPVISAGGGTGDRKDKNKKPPKSESSKTKALLSFADDEEEDSEVFQVRKSSHSKKVMRMMDKERRKKKREERGDYQPTQPTHATFSNNNSGENGRSFDASNCSKSLGSSKYKSASSSSSSSLMMRSTASTTPAEQCKSNKNDCIQTEIRTDDFVLVVKKSEPDPDLILNGRAALCAGRNDLSDEEFDGDHKKATSDEDEPKHRFSKPEVLKQMLESGSIPDAAMIHAARKRRQKAREQGDFIPVEEPKEVPKMGSRLAREDMEGDQSDDEERVDMNGITGIKEREERREQFYSVQNDYSDEDSDHETNEWENQQIRKGVTGAQLVSAQHESVLSRFMIPKASSGVIEPYAAPQSTSTLLEQAYAKNAFEKPQHALASTKVKKDKTKGAPLRTPQEIRDAISTRLNRLKEVHREHNDEIERIGEQLKLLKLEEIDCTQKAPTAAAKYRFYQEIKCYVGDLVDCLNEKLPLIIDLEKRSLQFLEKHQSFLIERRRQDVRDQAKEMAESIKPAHLIRHGPEHEDQVRRAAEREGRRTRRRCERERNEIMVSHLDGMSSDDEVSDRYEELLQSSLEQIYRESDEIFGDVNDEFCKVEMILMKFYAWRKTDMESYKNAFVSLCLPKILGPIIRQEMLTWSPIREDNKDLEKMDWYSPCMLYAWEENETEDSLKEDPDHNLVPTIIEKIILPKVTEIVNQCWDPVSTTQTLRLIGFINRLGRDYTLKESTKSLQTLFNAILDKMKLALENDVFIPIFPKQVHEAKTSFFQRQFCSGLKLFRNFLSWQGIVADWPLREMAISSLLNRYLLMALRVCSANDTISKAYIIVNTLPTVWLQPDSDTIKSLELFVAYVKETLQKCEAQNPAFMSTSDKAKQILQRLHHI